MEMKFMYNGIKINGKLYKGSWSRSGYFKDHEKTVVCFATITFYSRGHESLPLCGLDVENNTDVMTDYFDTDRVHFALDHKLYTEAVEAWRLQETRSAKRLIQNIEKRMMDGIYRKYDMRRLRETQERLEKLSV